MIISVTSMGTALESDYKAQANLMAEYERQYANAVQQGEHLSWGLSGFNQYARGEANRQWEFSKSYGEMSRMEAGFKGQQWLREQRDAMASEMPPFFGHLYC